MVGKIFRGDKAAGGGMVKKIYSVDSIFGGQDFPVNSPHMGGMDNFCRGNVISQNS